MTHSRLIKGEQLASKPRDLALARFIKSSFPFTAKLLRTEGAGTEPHTLENSVTHRSQNIVVFFTCDCPFVRTPRPIHWKIRSSTIIIGISLILDILDNSQNKVSTDPHLDQDLKFRARRVFECDRWQGTDTILSQARVRILLWGSTWRKQFGRKLLPGALTFPCTFVSWRVPAVLRT